MKYIKINVWWFVLNALPYRASDCDKILFTYCFHLREEHIHSTIIVIILDGTTAQDGASVKCNFQFT